MAAQIGYSSGESAEVDLYAIYRLVLETLGPVPKDRKCFRLINGVLVERTVADVVPALQTNAEGLKNVLEGLVKEYKKKQAEMDAWKVCTSDAILQNCPYGCACAPRLLRAGALALFCYAIPPVAPLTFVL
jgi:chaperonin cofactor prefoldin